MHPVVARTLAKFGHHHGAAPDERAHREYSARRLDVAAGKDVGGRADEVEVALAEDVVPVDRVRRAGLDHPAVPPGRVVPIRRDRVVVVGVAGLAVSAADRPLLAVPFVGVCRSRRHAERHAARIRVEHEDVALLVRHRRSVHAAAPVPFQEFHRLLALFASLGPGRGIRADVVLEVRRVDLARPPGLCHLAEKVVLAVVWREFVRRDAVDEPARHQNAVRKRPPVRLHRLDGRRHEADPYRALGLDVHRPLDQVQDKRDRPVPLADDLLAWRLAVRLPPAVVLSEGGDAPQRAADPYVRQIASDDGGARRRRRFPHAARSRRNRAGRVVADAVGA